MKTVCVVLAVLAVCCLQSTYAVKCYQCRSWTDPDCGKEHYNAKNKIIDCDTQQKPSAMKSYMPVTKCHKIVTKDAVGEIVTRDCHFEAVGDTPDTCIFSDNRQVLSCNVCKGDICNGSSGAARVTVGLMGILAFVVMKLAL